MESSDKITKSIRTEDVKRDWWVVDAEDLVVGRAAARIAVLLRGKHKAYFTPHVDCGDFVVVVNAEKIRVKGKREEMKEYFTHSGYPGRGKFRSFKDLLRKNPRYIVEHAVRGMLPKNRLGRKMIRKLKVYAGPEHPHSAQSPKEFKI